MSDSKFLTFSLQESLRPYLTLSDLQVNQSLAKFQIGEVAFSVFVAQLHSSGSSRSIQENRVQIHRELIERQRSLSEQGYKIGFLGMFPEGDAFIAWDPRHVLSLNAAKAASIYGRWTLRNIALKNSAGAHKFNSRSLGGELSFAIALPSQGLGHYLANIEHIHQLQSESDIQLWFSNVEGLLSGTVLEGNKQNLEQAIRERYVSNRYSYPRSPKFKFDVLEAYEYSCCICDRQLDLIQAAHIIPHSHENSVDEVRNGLALCVEHHLLYDDALLLPGPDYDLVFNQERAKVLMDSERDRGIKDVEKFAGRRFRIPSRPEHQPSKEYLQSGLSIRMEH